MMNRCLTAVLTLCLLALLGCDAADPLGAAESEDAVLAKKGGGAASLAGQGDSYVLIAKSGLPSDLADEVAAAGGTLTKTFPEIGVAFATASASNFQSAAARIQGMETVQPDLVLDWVAPPELEEEVTDSDAGAEGSGSLAADEPLAFYQWALDPVGAPAAWDAGYTGEGVRVAILDGGLYAAHPDLQENVDVAASASFVPGLAFNQDTGTFWHGTHVAGIVGAGDNGFGTIGIAPNAMLVGVKVLHDGSGAFSWIINGIMYAATPRAEGGGGADVINMSLGVVLDEKDKEIKKAVKELAKAFDRATKYAYKQGVVTVAAAGNDFTNFDEEKDLLSVPAESKHVLSVSATGPIGWGRGATNFANPAYYTNIGKKLVDLGAPGGNFALAIVQGDFSPCTVGGFTATCALFDGYLSTSRGTGAGSWSWAQGTSMASPVVAGVAALVIEQSGKDNPAAIISQLQRTADDLGKPGQDAYYGHGFINAARAVSAEEAHAAAELASQ